MMMRGFLNANNGMIKVKLEGTMNLPELEEDLGFDGEMDDEYKEEILEYVHLLKDLFRNKIVKYFDKHRKSLELHKNIDYGKISNDYNASSLSVITLLFPLYNVDGDLEKEEDIMNIVKTWSEMYYYDRKLYTKEEKRLLFILRESFESALRGLLLDLAKKNKYEQMIFEDMESFINTVVDRMIDGFETTRKMLNEVEKVFLNEENEESELEEDYDIPEEYADTEEELRKETH